MPDEEEVVIQEDATARLAKHEIATTLDTSKITSTAGGHTKQANSVAFTRPRFSCDDTGESVVPTPVF